MKITEFVNKSQPFASKEKSLRSENCGPCKASDSAKSIQRENYGPCKASDSVKSIQRENYGACKASDSVKPAQKDKNWSQVAAEMAVKAVEIDELIEREIKEAEREIERKEEEMKEFKARQLRWGIVFVVWLGVYVLDGVLNVLSIVLWKNTLMELIFSIGFIVLSGIVAWLSIHRADTDHDLIEFENQTAIRKIKEKEDILKNIRFKLGVKNEEDDSESE